MNEQYIENATANFEQALAQKDEKVCHAIINDLEWRGFSKEAEELKGMIEVYVG